MKRLESFELFLFASILLNCDSQNLTQKPNLVIFLADDVGIGDLGCYGNKTVQTPSLDRLCKEGAKFSHHLAGGALCTPSRAAFMTGRYPIRYGMEGEEGTPAVTMYVSARAGLPENETTWAKVLQRNGYTTAAIGKWHLGWDDSWKGDNKHGPLGHGFDYFFGLPFTLVDGFDLDLSFFTYTSFYSKERKEENPLHNHGVAFALSLLTVFAVYSRNFGYFILFAVLFLFLLTWFFVEHFSLHKEKWWQRSLYMEKFLNSVLMRNKRIAEQPINLETLTEKLTKEALQFLKDQKSKDKPFALLFSFPNVHTPLVPSNKSKGKSKHGAYGDSIIDMDQAVGSVLDTLEEMGKTGNTFVFFASDHGSHIDLGNSGGSNRPFKGGKGMGAEEGGIRIPAIAKWPGKIKSNSVIDTPTSLLDFFPTIKELVGDDEQDDSIDGVSYLGELLHLPLNQNKSENISNERVKVDTRIFRHYCGMSLHALRIKTKDKSVLKAYFRRVILNDEGHCGIGNLCPCYGNGVESFLDQPVLFDVNQDPTEEHPISPEDKRYKVNVPVLKEEFQKAESEWYPESQYRSAWNVMPRPWIQPCANFPLCMTSG